MHIRVYPVFDLSGHVFHVLEVGKKECVYITVQLELTLHCTSLYWHMEITCSVKYSTFNDAVTRIEPNHVEELVFFCGSERS